MFKLSFIVLLTVLAVSGNVIQKRNTDIAIERLVRLERDLDSIEKSRSTDSTLNTIFTAVASAVAIVIIGAFCSYITPYLALLELFRTTLMAAAVLILEFISNIATNYASDWSGYVTSATSGVTWVNETISTILTTASNAGCSI